MQGQPESFEAVKSRLEEIVDAVNAEGITLDEALSLYEEAVKLGLSVCDLSEQDALAAADLLAEEASEGAEVEPAHANEESQGAVAARSGEAGSRDLP